MVQTHESIQLNYGAATILGLCESDKKYTLQQLQEGDNEPRPVIQKYVTNIIYLFEVNDEPVWLVISKSTKAV